MFITIQVPQEMTELAAFARKMVSDTGHALETKSDNACRAAE
jgi:hypothetical protein